MGLLDILQQVTGGNAEQHFDQVASQASGDQLGAALAAALRSDQTAPFGQQVGQMFGASSPEQQAGLLNQVLAALGPAAASGLAGGVLGRLLAPGQTQLTPDQASQITPAQAAEIATHAEQQHAGIVDQVSRFYADHSGLIKTLGGTALMIALAKIKENASRG
ncbi:MAG: hypothetical protein QM586_16875 [Xenophilus sp.]